MQSSLMPDVLQVASRGGFTKKKHKPFAVWYMGGFWCRRKWRRWNRYTNQWVAEKALANLERKYTFWQWRVGDADEKGGSKNAN